MSLGPTTNQIRIVSRLVAAYLVISGSLQIAAAVDLEAADALKIYSLEMELYHTKVRAEKRALLKKLISKEAAGAGMDAQEWEDQFFEVNSVNLNTEKIRSIVKKGDEAEFEKAKAMFLEQRKAELLDKLWESLSKKYGWKINVPLPRIPKISIDAGDQIAVGKKLAPVQIVEFYDLECPYCKKANQVNSRIRREFAGQIRWIAFDFPSEKTHPAALAAHIASRCAAAQEKFFEYRDLLYVADELNEDNLKASAKQIQLNGDKFQNCRSEDKKSLTEKIHNNVEYGKKLGISGTPTLFINGRPYPGYRSYETIKKAITETLHHKQ
jgi:protein-disulfide isomerase